jgi:ABC-2 type transport system permease protein
MNSIELATPSRLSTFRALFKADLRIQWRNRRASLMTLLVPIIILVSWTGIVAMLGGPSVMSSCITIGLIAVGLMGYANSTARAREKGIFQRLRVTPAGTFEIMASRVAVQLLQMFLMAVVLFIAAYFIDHITLSVGGYVLGTLVSVLCGAVFLALGLALVGLVRNAETVNSISRFVYIALVVVGAIGELGVLGTLAKDIVLWSPYGSVKILLLAAMQPSMWDMTATYALIASLAYCIVFSFIGIRWFKWTEN